MKVLMITGSRSLKNEPGTLMLFAERALRPFPPAEWVLIHGGAQGVDQMVGAWAEHWGYEVQVYPADWAKYGKAAGFIRNAQMAAVADACVGFWDGVSRGTKHAIDTCRGLDVQTTVYWPR